MERDDIIRMAREAGFREYLIQDSLSAELERFAALVAAHERQECAKVAATVAQFIDDTNGTATYIAKAIRARGEKPKRHPGYIIGDHWLQAAYTRVCTGETEDEVMTDYGWQRESR